MEKIYFIAYQYYYNGKHGNHGIKIFCIFRDFRVFCDLNYIFIFPYN